MPRRPRTINKKLDKQHFISKKDMLMFAITSSQIEREYSDEAYADHLEAFEYLLTQSKLTIDNILHCHSILQKRLRPDIAGKLRNCNVRVGNRVCPDWTLVSGLLNEWLRLSDTPEKITTEEMTKLAHIAFEGVHPFEDGNGRVGRCILNWHRVLLNLPILIIEPGEEQFAYYQWFRE